jgi:hypothetical protein
VVQVVALLAGNDGQNAQRSSKLTDEQIAERRAGDMFLAEGRDWVSDSPSVAGRASNITSFRRTQAAAE